MKALFIGGTGTISTAITRRLVEELGWELWLINRGNRPDAVPKGVHSIVCDINDEAAVLEKLGDMTFDCVGEFIGFTLDQVKRDWRLFKGRTRQYLYISSASAYHKPAASYVSTEGTTLATLLAVQPGQDRLRGIPDGKVSRGGLPGDHRAPQPHL